MTGEKQEKGRGAPRRAARKKEADKALPPTHGTPLDGGTREPSDPPRSPESEAASDPAQSRVAGETPEVASPSDEVFLDIIKKAREGNIKYQELFLKYIDLISQKTTEEDEIIYEATFVDDKDKET